MTKKLIRLILLTVVFFNLNVIADENICEDISSKIAKIEKLEISKTEMYYGISFPDKIEHHNLAGVNLVRKLTIDGCNDCEKILLDTKLELRRHKEDADVHINFVLTPIENTYVKIDAIYLGKECVRTLYLRID